MIDGHVPITVDDFRGLWSRGDSEATPEGYFTDCLNVRYGYRKVSSRYGSIIENTTSFNIKRFHIYNRTGEAPRLLILDSTGKLWDSAIGFVTPILNIATMTDFSLTVLFNRAYITPHDRNRGLASEIVYVYQGSGTARAAAGLPPSGFSLGVATSSTSGVIDAGSRLYAVVFETDTGFITAPGPTIFTTYIAPGSKAIDFSSIPVGPAGTTARRLLSTKLLTSAFDGNQVNVEYFFIPNGRIANNSATTLNSISYYDSELVDSADYLFDQLSTIPAGVGIGQYRGSLVVWGSNASDRIVYVSNAGEPESIDGVDGVIEVRDDGRGGVKNCVEYRDLLLIHKNITTYVTQDNNDTPSTWIVNSADLSVGTECFGVGQILDQTGNILDYYVIADVTALRLMDGTFKTELSYPIADLWLRINKAQFSQVQIVVDPLSKLIYCLVPLDSATTPSHVLVCDYGEGLDPTKVKWAIWTFVNAPNSIAVDVDFTTKKSIFKFSRATTNTYKQSTSAFDDYGTQFAFNFKIGGIGYSEADGESQFIGARVRIRGVGSFQLNLTGLDGVNPVTAPLITLTASPGRPYTFKFNYVTNKAFFQFIGGFNNGDNFTLNKIKIYGSEMWLETPTNPS